MAVAIHLRYSYHAQCLKSLAITLEIYSGRWKSNVLRDPLITKHVMPVQLCAVYENASFSSQAFSHVLTSSVLPRDLRHIYFLCCLRICCNFLSISSTVVILLSESVIL